MQKVIVFGGAGFIGSHVADELTNQGFEVVIFDRYQSPYLKNNQTGIVGDILDLDMVKEAMKGCDVVYNYAGVADIDKAKAIPLDTVRNNILGNTILLEAARILGVKRFVFASSLYVYSNAGSFYRSSKQACELIIENYHNIYDLNYTILRYGSLYGPRSNEDNWIYYVLKQALTKGKIVRMGDGDELREYIHVQDAARLSVDVLAGEYENEHVIITGSQQIKVRDLLIMIREMLQGNVEVEYKPSDCSEHYEITPYIFKPTIAKRLNRNNYVDLGQGILEMLGDIYNTNVVKNNVANILVRKNLDEIEEGRDGG
jgi:UDP-glucose 4-epimerase